MITKPAISFLTNDSDSVLVTDVGGILTAMSGNPDYPTPSPSLADVTLALNAFSVAISTAAGGGVALTAAKNAPRAELISLVRQLASYVQVACQGDMTKLLGSGFPIQKNTRQSVGPLPAPAGVTVSLGAISGQLAARFKPVFGALVYSWRLSTAAAPADWKDMGQSSAASNVFDDLTPGTIYNVQANAVGTAGPSDWSNIATQMAL